MQAAQNHLNQLDMGAFRREIEDVAKRLEGRPGSADRFPVQVLGKMNGNSCKFFFRCLDVPLLQACCQNGENV